VVAAVIGACGTGEKTLTAGLLPRLAPGMLVLAGRNFAGCELWRDAAATGAELLWRIGVSFSLPVDEVLADGTYLSRLKAPRALRREGAAGITVRVIEYRLEEGAGEVTETFTLVTTLLDPDAAPARELAELYHARWQTGTALGAFKTGMKGARIALRSKTPRGAEQEIWALLCACHAIREMICAAAALARQDPLRISFVNALDTVRGPVGDPAGFPPDQLEQVTRAALAIIGSVTNPDRHGRSNPRQAKRSTSYPARPADPARRPRPRGRLTLVMLPVAADP
jgi:hypothetical protein